MAEATTTTTTNVTFGSPRVKGVFYTAPYGTALPTDATTELTAEWSNNGYVSKDGIKNAPDMNTSSIEEMGGTTILTALTGYSETYQFTLLEVMRATAANTAYGSGAASADESGNLTITHAMPTGKFSAVIDLQLNGGRMARIVIPSAVVSKLGDRTISGTAEMGYDVTVTANAYADYATSDGRIGTSREFIAALAA